MARDAGAAGVLSWCCQALHHLLAPAAVVAAVAAGLVAPSGAGAAGRSRAGPDPLYVAENALQLTSGPVAPTARFASDWYANRAFLPDWDHDGVYGDDGDVGSEQAGVPAQGAFLYPCIADDGAVTYQTTTGACAAPGAPGVVFKRGVAQRFKAVDARGLALTAVLWLPEVALQPGASGLPGLVFSSGASVAQRSFYMYNMAAAAAGFVVLSYDPIGQGTSEGREWQEEFSAPASGQCRTTVKCRELQEMVRWFTGAPITRSSPTLGRHDPAYQPAGENPINPALGVVDRSKVAIAGQSNGGLAVSNYLELLPSGRDADGQPLPAVAAAVALSGFAPASSVVPVQAQTADLDLPGVTADNFGLNATDGPLGTKAWYDQLRTSGRGDGMLQLIIIEGGSHGDTSNIPGAPHATWAWALSTGYLVDFLSCTVQHDPGACHRTTTARPHLSQAYASEDDPDGAAGPSPSRCMTIPTKPSLEMALDPTNPAHLAAGVLGSPPYTCTP